MFKKLQSKKGFTLIELMIVVAILGVLAAVAIPQYLDYIAASKSRAAASNYDTAIKAVKGEFAKRTAGADSSTNMVDTLNDSGRNVNPYEPSQLAYVAAGAQLGQVTISPVDTTIATIAQGDAITVTANYLDMQGNTVASTMDITYE